MNIFFLFQTHTNAIVNSNKLISFYLFDIIVKNTNDIVFGHGGQLGLLSHRTALSRYHIEDTDKDPLKERVFNGLQKNSILSIDDETAAKVSGWSSFADPFQTKFDDYSFVYGDYFAFSLRIDKKTIPANLIRKHVALASKRKRESVGRAILSRDENRQIKEHVINTLYLRIPATPSIYNVLWNYEKGMLFFFSNQKTANEELETLFYHSFHLRLIRLFPYMLADLVSGLSSQERDVLQQLTPAPWST